MAALAVAVFIAALAVAYGLARFYPGTVKNALLWFTRLRWAIASLGALVFAFFALSSGVTFLIIIGGAIVAVAALYLFVFGRDGVMP